ncbi:MAG TPA: 1-(5-phosphoribosyl)-5-[(5-phosphoribosylamino)methylideneamino]imidazole-4-carboxamide isomerase [Candidatus Binataceae bacterium]|nr:1-(5-phosphoribosyl)-5-[(5-phosphoribosylamino)methylideneamino]imidazole-4-carboxamide isomerase [Candidatus Binataceae bacterium]
MFARFTVIPAIDLKDGKVVRLTRGAMDSATVYGDDPAAVARGFEAAGAEVIHLVDLDGAIAGEPRNLAALSRIRAAVSCPLEASGGLRTTDSVRRVIEAGADRISIGSAALTDPPLLAAACRMLPGRVLGSIDVRDGRLALKGWVATSELPVSEAIARFRAAGVAAVIYTDIGRDGTQAGVEAEAMAEFASRNAIAVIASGGVAALADIRALSDRFGRGVVGVVVGRALYEGNFSLGEAIGAAHAPRSDGSP